MVNFTVSDLPSDAVTRILGRAVQAADVALVLADAAVPGAPVVWVSRAFTALTGYTAADAVGRDAGGLQGPTTGGPTVQALLHAAAEEAPATATVLHHRRDGSTFRDRVAVWPVHDDSGRLTHWLTAHVDVTDDVQGVPAGRDAAPGADTPVVVGAAGDHERGPGRHLSGLAVIAQVSELLSDLEDPRALRDIADLLRHHVVAWAGFFLDENGLRSVDGIDLTVSPAAHSHRHGPPPLTTVHQQALALAEAGAAADAPPDPVQQLLDGTVDGPVELDVTADVDGAGRTAAGWLTGYLRPVLAGLPGRPTTAVVLPIQGRRRVLGVLVAVPGTTQRQSGPDAEALGPVGRDGLEDETARTVLRLTARRVGMAVENARLYAREHRLAETLQRAMLPEQAEIVGLDVWTYYAPSAAHAQVGGDWYDVLQVSPDVVGIVVGDVAGHDVEAAAAMGQLRSVVRAYAYEQPAPAAVLERVDQLVAGMRIPRSASLVLGTLRRTPSVGWAMQYSRAGHLPPVLVRGTQVRQLAAATGPLIGFGSGPRGTGTEALLPGDVLVFYTGGLIERRDRPMRDGVALLERVCGEVSASDAAGFGEGLLTRLADAPEDDVAVVVVRLPDPHADARAGGAGDPRQRRWLLPSEPASIARARHAVLRTCQAWELPDAPNAELVTSELIANAVLHGWGAVSLRLFDTGDGLRIEVEDLNPAPPVATDGHPGRVGGFGMQIVERLADWGWRPSGGGKLVWARIRPSSPGPQRR